jgi:S1-C subfamily serine protease
VVLGAQVAPIVVPARAGDLPSTIERIRPSIVGVGTYQKLRSPEAQLLGTGFVVGDGLHVLTNAHVANARQTNVEKGEQLAVFVGRGANPEIRRAERVSLDHDHDVALLRISGRRLPALTLDGSNRVREGQEYAFTGFPIGAVLGLYPATHRALIAAITPVVTPKVHATQLNPASIKRIRSPFYTFQLDATAYPGNSGSPLYDPETGRVVGIVNMVFVKESKENVLAKPSGITYAIPVQFARILLEQTGVSP